MAQPRLSKSLMTLRDQVNKLAPKRSKASDGWIGDAKHSMRKSDHNPEPDGTVDALDITHDPKNGVDIQKLCDTLIAARDRRVSYLICNGKIISGTGGKQPWVKRPYSGANKHTKHLHVSINDAHQDDTTTWKIQAAFGKAAQTPKPTAPPPSRITPKERSAVLKLGSQGDFVAELQVSLNALGYGPIKVDGSFDASTEKSVKALQRASGLAEDGWAGPRTTEAIGKALQHRETAPKMRAAEKVVDDAAAEGKAVSRTEIVTGVTGVTGVATAAKEITESVQDGASSLASLGPWILLALVLAGGAGWVIYDRRRKRIAARAAQVVMQ